MGKWLNIYGEMKQNYGEVKENAMGNRLNFTQLHPNDNDNDN